MVYEQPLLLDTILASFSPVNTNIIIGLLALSLVLLVLFILHSLTFWLSTDPEKAFHVARGMASGTSTLWNSIRVLYNTGKKIAFKGVPAWNLMAKHYYEPAVHISIDVMSLVFAHKHFQGVISDSSSAGGIPFRGHYCGQPKYRANGDYDGSFTADVTTSKYCAFQTASIWGDSLGVDQSGTDASNAVGNGSTLVLATATARRLQALATDSPQEGESVFPAMPIGPLLEAIQELAGISSMLQGLQLDIMFHIINTVLDETAVLLFNIAKTVVMALASAIMGIISSGALTNVLKMGIDLIMIMVVHVVLPIVFAFVDIVMCMLDYIKPAAWDAQLLCIKKTCFKEDGDIGMHPHLPPTLPKQSTDFSFSQPSLPLAPRIGNLYDVFKHPHRWTADCKDH